MKSSKLIVFFRSLLAVFLLLGLLLSTQEQAHAATTLTVTPITWNVIGLDSNNVNVGPNRFPVGTRVCNTGGAAASNVTADFVWDSANSYISIRPGTNSTLSVSNLGAGICTDFYFEVEVTRDASAYNTTRSYHISVTADGGATTGSTPTPRELFVEHLISQSRNSTNDVQLSADGSSFTSVSPGGTMTLMVGQTYWIKLVGSTATNGYEQLETFLTLPNVIFQVLSVDTTYTANNFGSPIGLTNDKLYADACSWENNPNSPNYRSCLSTGKNGDSITVTYKVNILSAPIAPLTNPEALQSLIYDFSGSSYHYNADFSASARYAQIVDYSQLGFKKSFSPSSIQPDGVSTLTFTITNPFNIQFNGVQFTDPLPSTASPATQMKVAATPNAATSGCGSPTFSPSAGATSLSFSGGTLYPNGTCTIKVDVTAPGNGTTNLNYPNTTNHLFLDNGATDTNKTASATLTVGIVVSKPSASSSCTPSATPLATWNFENAGAPSSPSATASDVNSSATYTYGALTTVSGMTNVGLSTVSSHSTTHSWAGQGGWLLDGTVPTNTSAPYFDFSVDTRHYAFVRITYWVDLEGASGAWASNSNPFYVFTSKDGGSTWVAANPASQVTNKGSWVATTTTFIADTTGGVDNTGSLNTIFRIIPTGSKSGSQANAILYLDDVSITGCQLPNPPTLTKSFSPNPVQVGTSDTLTFTVTNPAGNISSLTNITFNDTLPTGLNVTAGTVSACGGTATLTAATSTTPASISFTRASALTAGSNCTIPVTVTPTINAVFNNTSGYISADESGGNTTSTGYATASLTAYLPPQITKTYTPDSILSGGTSNLTYVITNPNAFNSLTGINFLDNYAGTMTNTGTLNITNNTCGVTISGSGSGTSIGIPVGQNLTLAAGASCTFTVDVTATTASTTPVAITSGTTVYATGASGSIGATGTLALTGNTTSATLYVRALLPALKLSKQVGTSSSGPWYSSSELIPAGSPVYYRFVVENTGDAAFTSFNVTDPTLAGVFGDPISCTWSTPNSPSTLPNLPLPTQTIDPSAICVAGPTTASAGYLTNTATAHGTSGSVYDSNTDKASYMNGNFGHLPVTNEDANPSSGNYPGYNTYNDGGAFALNGSTFLGTSVTTTDTDGTNNATFTIKPTDNGVTWTGLWNTGTGHANMVATCDPAGTRTVYGWFDWNNDGDFTDPNETQNWTVICSPAGTANSVSIQYAASGNLPAGTFYARFRIYDTDPISPQPYGIAKDGSGNPIVGEIEDYAMVSNGTGGTPTPVTLSYFQTELQGSDVVFNWSTETETGNVGFNLYTEKNGQKTRLNDQLIPSLAVDSLERQDYSFSARTDGDTFFLEEVSVMGETRLRGPFQLGETYGDRVDATPIDWNTIQAEHHLQPQAAPAIIPASAVDDGSAAPDIAPAQPPDLQPDSSSANTLTFGPLVNLQVRQSGFYRVSFEMLRDAGFDLSNIPTAKLQLTNQGKAVPIFINAKTPKFDSGSYFEFYGQALDTIYTDTNIYTLQVAQKPGRRMSVANAAPNARLKSPTSFTDILAVNNQKVYVTITPSNDPWYDTAMLTYKSSKSWSFPFEINDLANPKSPASLKVVLWGGTSLPQNPDHHVVVSLNGIVVANQTFDGMPEQIIQVTLPPNLLSNGTNTLQLTLPGDTGAAYDGMYFDQFSLTYQHAFVAQDGRLTFTASGKTFTVSNLPSQNVVVYRLDPRVGPVRLNSIRVRATGSTYTATFAGNGKTATYMVSAVEALYAPALEAPRTPASNLNLPAQYLVVAYPDFIPGLQPLIQARQAQGLSVNVVDVNDLYAKYTYGVFDPQAIKTYIAYAYKNLGTQYVLLVGGDTYDYRNYLGKNSISFIPSLYTATGPYVKFVPVDPLFADVNGDNIPDLAIGRFPVRTSAELDLMVSKTLAYEHKTYNQTAVFAADTFDGMVNFKYISQGFVSNLPAGWNTQTINLDDTTIAAARNQLVAAMNSGTALVTYTGHSGPTSWSTSNLFNTQSATTLTNAGRPFVAVQWGCWNNYYVNPTQNYLVQSLLVSGDKGAVAVLGASTLTESESERLLGQLLTPRLTTPGVTIGQALQLSKAELAASHPDLADVLLGWSLMGDPALKVVP